MNAAPPTQAESADLLWREFEYRHAFFWKSMNLWGAAVLAITLVPYVRSETDKLGSAVFLFPMTALALSLLGGWHLSAEVARFQAVRSRYEAVAGTYVPRIFDPEQRRGPWRQALSEPIGSVVAWAFLIGFVGLSAINAIFLYEVTHPRRGTSNYWIAFVLFGVLLGVLVLTPFVRARRHNRGLAARRALSLTRIAADPALHGGHPFIRGTDVHVTRVLDLLAAGVSPEQAARQTLLAVDDVTACLRYASDLIGQRG